MWIESGGFQSAAQAVSAMVLASLWQCLLVAVVYSVLRALIRPPGWRVVLGYVALWSCAGLAIWQFWQAFPAMASANFDGQVLHPIRSSPDNAAVGTGATAVSHWQLILAGFWLLGVLAQSGRVAHQWWLMRRWIRQASPVVQALHLRTVALAATMGVRRTLRVLVSEQVSSLMTVGWIRPVILIPASVLTGIPAAHLDLLILHEIAHIRRADWLLNLGQLLVETLLFFHPAVHWISATVRRDRELCCDDLVTRRGVARLAYAHALLQLAEMGQILPSARNRLAMAAGDGVLLHRIGRIVNVHPDPRARRPMRIASFLLFLAGILGLLAMSHWRASQQSAIGWAAQLEGARAIIGALPLLWRDTASMKPVLSEVNDIALTFHSPSHNLEDPRTALTDLVERGHSLVRVSPQIDSQALDVADLEIDVTVPQERSPESSQTDQQSDLRPLTSPQPSYPVAARRDASEGRIVLRFKVDQRGRAVDDQLLEQRGVDAFLDASRQALGHWRFPPQATLSDWQLVRFDFALGDTAPKSTSRRDCQRIVGSRICWPMP
ncbi:MAG: energy transducer TonB [Aquimonas sp.]|nr:energy transducer TonB [Aquimonas sp.]